MESKYWRQTFLAGKSKQGLQLHRDIRFSSIPVKIEYEEIRTMEKVWGEEDEDGNTPWEMKDRVVRPKMTIETVVTRCKNKFGIIRLYGPQGIQKEEVNV